MEKVMCQKCKKTLFYADYGKIEIKCPRCGILNIINVKTEQRQESKVRTVNQ